MRHLDETFERGMQFVKNMDNLRPGVSNLYVFSLIDEDGNIKDEKYGMNLMTNTAMNDIYSSNQNFEPSSSIRLYVGQGTGTITTDTNSIRAAEICFNGLAATNKNTNKDYNYPLYFSASNPAGNGLITLISRFMICEYPANIDNAPDQVRISEYGIGKNWDNLWTHSHVYDKTGARADIYKTQNEVLRITVYMCLSFRETLITDGWANDVYAVITTNQIMFHRMFETNLKTYKRDDKVYNRTTYNRGDDQYHSISVGSTYVNSSTLPAFDLIDGSDNSKGYIDGFIYQTDGFMILEPQYLSTPETIELTNFYSETPYDHSGFSNKFGKYPKSGSYLKAQYPPITRVLSASAYMFDYYDNAWSNQLSLYNPSNKKYTDDTPAQTTTAMPITYYANDAYITGYIHQNIDTNDRILSIDNDSISITVYATDAYWDRSSWIVITNKNSIPPEAQRCRYWITGDNNDNNKLKFVRESDTFQLLTKGGTTPAHNGYYEYTGFDQEYGSAPQCDGNGWFMRGNKLYVPYTQRVYLIGTSYTNKNTLSMTYGKYVVTFNDINNKIYVTDTTNATTSSDIPPSTEITLDWGSGVNINSYYGCYITESKTGIICMNSTNSSVKLSAIIDLRDATRVNVTMLPTRMACAIYGKSKVAYVHPTNDEIRIYDVPTATDDGNPIPFPTGVSSIPLMFGHSKYIWISSSTFGYYINFEEDPTRTPLAAALNITYSSNLYMVRATILDDMFLIYKIDELTISSAHYILLATPQQSHDLSDLNVSHNYTRANIYFHLREIQPSTISGVHHASIILVMNKGYSYNHEGANVIIYDFGQYLRTGEVHYLDYIQEYICSVTLYGEYLIWNSKYQSPIINWMPIKLVCTTDTITTFNTTKHISNKTWHLGYTNQPSWGDGSSDPSGIPPGVPLAVTNGEGTIIAWE